MSMPRATRENAHMITTYTYTYTTRQHPIPPCDAAQRCMIRWLLGYPSSHPSVRLSRLRLYIVLALVSRSLPLLPLPDASHNALPLYYLDPRIHSFLVGADVSVDLIGHARALPLFPPSPTFLRLRRVRTANLTRVCFRLGSELSGADLGLLVARCLSTWLFLSSALASRKQTVATLPCPTPNLFFRSFFFFLLCFSFFLFLFSRVSRVRVRLQRYVGEAALTTRRSRPAPHHSLHRRHRMHARCPAPSPSRSPLPAVLGLYLYLSLNIPNVQLV